MSRSRALNNFWTETLKNAIFLVFLRCKKREITTEKSGLGTAPLDPCRIIGDWEACGVPVPWRQRASRQAGTTRERPGGLLPFRRRFELAEQGVEANQGRVEHGFAGADFGAGDEAFGPAPSTARGSWGSSQNSRSRPAKNEVWAGERSRKLRPNSTNGSPGMPARGDLAIDDERRHGTIERRRKYLR